MLRPCLAFLLATSPIAGNALSEASFDGLDARGRVLAAVWIGEVGPYPFLVDAALSTPVIDTEAGAFLGLAVDASGAAKVSALRCGALPARPSPAAVIGLTPIAERLGARLAGMLPLHQPGYEVVVHAAAGTIAWRPLEQAALTAVGTEGLRMHLDDSGAPVVSALFLRKHLRPVQIDLNHSGVAALSEATLRAIGALDDDTPRLVTKTAAGKTTHVRLDEVALDGVRIAGALCEVLPGDEADRVGLGLLRHGRATLNYEYGRFRLEAVGGRHVQTPPLRGCGLALARFRDGAWGLSVAAGSPAAEAGIVPADRLIAVGSDPEVSLAPSAVEEALRGVGLPSVDVVIEGPAGQRELRLSIVPLL